MTLNCYVLIFLEYRTISPIFRHLYTLSGTELTLTAIYRLRWYCLAFLRYGVYNHALLSLLHLHQACFLN